MKTSKYTFGKNQKIKNRNLFRILFTNKAKHYVSNSIMLKYLVEESLDTNILFGVSVSKKKFKKAVDRNRTKRLIRESFRLNKHQLEDIFEDNSKTLVCFYIFIGTKDHLNFQTIDEDIKKSIIFLKSKLSI